MNNWFFFIRSGFKSNFFLSYLSSKNDLYAYDARNSDYLPNKLNQMYLFYSELDFKRFYSEYKFFFNNFSNLDVFFKKIFTSNNGFNFLSYSGLLFILNYNFNSFFNLKKFSALSSLGFFFFFFSNKYFNKVSSYYFFNFNYFYDLTKFFNVLNFNSNFKLNNYSFYDKNEFSRNDYLVVSKYTISPVVSFYFFSNVNNILVNKLSVLEFNVAKDFFKKISDVWYIKFGSVDFSKYFKSTNLYSNIIYFLRKNKVFNKGRYSRNRQIYRTGVYWCLYINIIAVVGLYFWFYRFVMNFGYVWVMLFLFIFSFFLPKVLKFRLYNVKEFISAYLVNFNALVLFFCLVRFLLSKVLFFIETFKLRLNLILNLFSQKFDFFSFKYFNFINIIFFVDYISFFYKSSSKFSYFFIFKKLPFFGELNVFSYKK
jgi:hypothetical protein